MVKGGEPETGSGGMSETPDPIDHNPKPILALYLHFHSRETFLKTLKPV